MCYFVAALKVRDAAQAAPLQKDTLLDVSLGIQDISPLGLKNLHYLGNINVTATSVHEFNKVWLKRYQYYQYI